VRRARRHTDILTKAYGLDQPQEPRQGHHRRPPPAPSRDGRRHPRRESAEGCGGIGNRLRVGSASC
jgi:hypothetical protein